MPNHIANVLTLKGDQEKIDKMVELFSTSYPSVPRKAYDGDSIYHDPKNDNNFGWFNETTGVFRTRKDGNLIKLEGGIPAGWVQDFEEAWTRFPDFGKITKMPESLNISVHSGIETAVEHALKQKIDTTNLLGALKASNVSKSESPLNLDEKDWDTFITCLNNVKKYGHMYWYSWAIENWGTKWNAYCCEKKADNVFYFETAWSPVPDMIAKLAAQNPDVEITYEWSDEDTGSNCGTATMKGEEVTVIEFKNQSNEAYEMAFKLRPEYKKYYKLVNGKYKYSEQEETEEVE